jgi:hypothetical protein
MNLPSIKSLAPQPRIPLHELPKDLHPFQKIKRNVEKEQPSRENAPLNQHSHGADTQHVNYDSKRNPGNPLHNPSPDLGFLRLPVTLCHLTTLRPRQVKSQPPTHRHFFRAIHSPLSTINYASYLPIKDCLSPLSILPCSSADEYIFACASTESRSWRLAISAWETTSKSEPVAISTIRAKSASECRELPSARFDETDTAARRIWLVSPNRSLSGKLFVTAYTRSAKSIALCQTCNFSNVNIPTF